MKNPALVTSMQRSAESCKTVESLQQEVPVKKSLFDAGYFKRKPKPKPGWLSNDVRQYLAKDSKDRADEELHAIGDELKAIPLFQRIHPHVLQELTRNITIYTFRKDQVIIKEGHPAYAMYVIVFGSAAVLYRNIDKETGEEECIEVSELGHSSAFGEAALIHNVCRSATIKCKTVTQVLRIEREEFDKYLKTVLTRDDVVLEHALHTIPALKEFPWDEAKIEFSVMKAHTRLQRFPKHTTIMGGSAAVLSCVYFVVTGECCFEQDVRFTVEYDAAGYKKLKAVPSPRSDNSSADTNFYNSSNSSPRMSSTQKKVSSFSAQGASSRESTENVCPCLENDEQVKAEENKYHNMTDLQFHPPKIYTKRLEICSLHFGNYFGVGEDFTSSYITTRETVECILIPRFLLSKAGPKFLDNLRRDVEELYPSVQVVLDRYLELQVWEKYKKKVVKDLFERYAPKPDFNAADKTKPMFNKYF